MEEECGVCHSTNAVEIEAPYSLKVFADLCKCANMLMKSYKMVYSVSYKACEGCDKVKPETDFYKTIKKICKVCRDEYMREQREQTKEEEEIANAKRDSDIRKLKKTTITQRDAIRKMEDAIAVMQERMTDMELGLGEVIPVEPKKKRVPRVKDKK
ncbi:hypothetical protein BGZ92_007645 [Podila epicladia]|nr:hypothetical protein BGZ92_007645 [Podila epicladia]